MESSKQQATAQRVDADEPPQINEATVADWNARSREAYAKGDLAEASYLRAIAEQASGVCTFNISSMVQRTSAACSPLT